MASYLSQFNYQFIRGGGQDLSPSDATNPQLRRWIFLHGLMGFGLNWRRIASSLGPQDISFIFDQRGHGKSLKPQSNFSADDYAEDLELIRQELGWDKFILVGHSMGARNALIYAHRFGSYVEKLIIEDIGPEAKPDAITYYTELLDSIPTPFTSKLAAKEWLLGPFLSTPYGRAGGATLGQYLYANLIELEDGRADWRFSKFAIIESVRQGRARDHWQAWEHLNMPTLLVRGEQSKDLTSSVYQEMLARQPLAKGYEVTGAGHWVHFDKAEDFIALLLNFVNFDKAEPRA